MFLFDPMDATCSEDIWTLNSITITDDLESDEHFDYGMFTFSFTQ